jgi:Type IV secretion system proteins
MGKTERLGNAEHTKPRSIGMKNTFRNALLSTVVVLASFGSVANSYAQVPPVVPAPVDFVVALNPIFNLISQMNHRSLFMLIRATEIGTHAATLVVHANQLVANTNAMNANLNAINTNILNISNKNNDSSASIKEIRDHLIDDAGAAFPDGLGGLSNIPWYDSAADRIPRSPAAKKLTELYRDVKTGVDFIESPGLTNALNELGNRFDLEDVSVESEDADTVEKKVEIASTSLLISGMLAAGLADRTYSRADDGMDRVQGYLNALKESESIKTSLDINTRVLIDLLQVTNEQVKLSSAFLAAQSQELMIRNARFVEHAE